MEKRFDALRALEQQRVLEQGGLSAKKNACKIAEYTESLKEDGLSVRLAPELSDPFAGGK